MRFGKRGSLLGSQLRGRHENWTSLRKKKKVLGLPSSAISPAMRQIRDDVAAVVSKGGGGGFAPDSKLRKCMLGRLD